MKNSLVSVIIPCYNYGQFLADTLNSVLKQSYTNWECIIVDDGSTDNTREVAEKYKNKDDRFKYVYQNNQAMNAARNTGIRAAKGEMIAFLDADDKWLPDKLGNQIEIFKTTDADVVFSDYDLFDDHRTYPHNNPPFKKELEIQDFIAANPCRSSASGIMLKNEVIKRTGLFDVSLLGAEELDYWFRCALNGFNFAYCPSKDVLLRMHKESGSRNLHKMYYYHVIVLEKQLKAIEDSHIVIPEKEFLKAVRERLSKIKWYADELKRRDLALFTYFFGMKIFGLKYFSHFILRKFVKDLFNLVF